MEWKRQLPSPGCRTTRPFFIKDPGSSEVPPSLSLEFFCASGCSSRPFLKYGQSAVSCFPSHLSQHSGFVVEELDEDEAAAAGAAFELEGVGDGAVCRVDAAVDDDGKEVLLSSTPTEERVVIEPLGDLLPT